MLGLRSLGFLSLVLITPFAIAGPVPVRPPKTYDLKNVEWHVILHPETATIDGDVINTLHLLKPQAEVSFDCGPLTIGTVAVNGTPTTSDLKGETLTIQLPDKGAKQDYKVEIKYSGKPTAGVYFIDAATSYPAHTPVVYSQGAAEDNRYWLPTYDYPDNKATSEGYITVPKGWKALSNGKLLGEKTDKDQTTIHWKMDQPHSTYLISFVAGPYESGSEKWGNMPVEYWVPQGLLDWGKATFGGTNKIIDFYSKQLGVRYPYAKFAQSAVPEFMFGGMENITCITQTINALFPPDESGLRDSTELIAHELAHQWFGDLVTCATWKDTWINESFATFMPPFYTRATKGDEAFQNTRAGIFRGAIGMAGNGPVASTTFNYPSDIYRGQVYSGGAARLYMLMDKLGEKTFWAGVHNFLDTYKYQPATTEQFFASMSKSTGQDLTGFMQQWFLRGGIPHIAVRTEGTALVFTSSQPGFDIDPEAWIWNGTDWVKKTLHFTSTAFENRIEVGADLANAPVMIDPEGHYLLSQISNNPVPPDQQAALFDKLPAFSKGRFLETLGGNQAAVLTLIGEPQNHPYLARLIGLVELANRKTLVKYAWDDDPQVRSATIRRIRVIFKTDMKDDIYAAMKTDAAEDAYPSLRAAAYAALMQVVDDNSMAEKAWDRDVPGDTYRVEALKWWAAHDQVAARKHCLEALDKPLSQPVQVTAIQLLGTLKDAKGERTVYDHLVKVLQGKGFTLRRGAIQALVEYGDKAAIPLIEPVTHESLWMAREQAIRAIASLSRS